MLPAARRPVLAALVALALGPQAACQGQDTPGCRIARDVSLPAGPLDTLPAVRVEAASTVFLLGADPATGAMAWSGLDAAGAAVDSGSASVDAPAAGPWLAIGQEGGRVAVTVVWGKVDPADGLVDLWAEGLAVDGSIKTAPARIVDRQGAPGEIDAALVGAGNAPWAILTHGARDGSAVSVDQLGLVGLTLVGGISETAGAPAFNCPAGFHHTQGTTGGFLMQKPDTKDPTLRLVEWDGTVNITQNVYLGIDIDKPRCFFGARTGSGYGFAIQAAVGTYLVTYDTRTQNLVRSGVVGALRWGGEDKQPPVAGLGYTGDGWALAFSLPVGPQVRRLDAVGHVERGPLPLPVAGRAGGPVGAGWVGDPGLLWVTYLDGGHRRAVALDCKVQ